MHFNTQDNVVFGNKLDYAKIDLNGSKATSNIVLAQDKYEILTKRLESQDLNEGDLKDFFVINQNALDLNKDGKKEKIYFLAVPLEANKDYFWQPGYLVYEFKGKLRKFKLDFYPLDLTKDNIKIRYGDISGDKIPEIIYSVDIPQMEHVERQPRILRFNPNKGKFYDLDVAKKYGYLITNWDLKKLSNGKNAIWFDLKKHIYDDKPLRKYFEFEKGRFIRHI
jgi:hypothetical protein